MTTKKIPSNIQEEYRQELFSALLDYEWYCREQNKRFPDKTATVYFKEAYNKLTEEEIIVFDFVKDLYDERFFRRVDTSGCGQPIMLFEHNEVVAKVFKGDRCNGAVVEIREVGANAKLFSEFMQKHTYAHIYCESSPTMFIGYTMSRKQYGS